MENLFLLDTLFGTVWVSDIRFLPFQLNEQQLLPKSVRMSSYLSVYEMKPKIVWVADTLTGSKGILDVLVVDTYQNVLLWHGKITGLPFTPQGLIHGLELLEPNFQREK